MGTTTARTARAERRAGASGPTIPPGARVRLDCLPRRPE